MVEVSCVVDETGIAPVAVGALPEAQKYLIQSVKHFERLAAEAVLGRDRTTAIEALAAHPLVLSYTRAEPLVDAFLAAHAPYAEGWR